MSYRVDGCNQCFETFKGIAGLNSLKQLPFYFWSNFHFFIVVERKLYRSGGYKTDEKLTDHHLSERPLSLKLTTWHVVCQSLHRKHLQSLRIANRKFLTTSTVYISGVQWWIN